MEIDLKHIEEVVGTHGRGREQVIPILQKVQEEYNYLPEEVLERICELTEITPAQIVSVASFYSQFRFSPAGRHMVKVCMGTACHVKGAEQVHDALKRELGLDEGQDTTESGEFTLEKVNCLGCCTLAPVVQIDEVTYGHVSTSRVSSVIEDFRMQGGKKGKKAFRRADGTEIEGEIRIGLGSCCVASGSEDVKQALEASIDRRGLPLNLKHVGCVGMCHQVPLVEVVPEGGGEPVLYSKVQASDVDQIVNRHFTSPGLFKRLGMQIADLADRVRDDAYREDVERYHIDVREQEVSSFLDRQLPMATEFRGIINPLDLEEYRSREGFEGLIRVLNELSPAELIAEIDTSGIRGRGGGGFPTGQKWKLVASQADAADATGSADTSDTADSTILPPYVICNGDEGDPGAFMDRMLLESYPYRVIEGMIAAGYATGAPEGILYIRAEYPLAVTRIQSAIEVCRREGILGKNIFGSAYNFDLHVFHGAGAFVCGEETALIASIEGKRGFPRMRPPYPAVQGLWGRPTLINNTETFAQVAYILKNGAADFSSHGTESSRGSKVFALAGKVARGGLIEVPMGMSIREVVEEIGGGVAEGRTFKAVQIGGPSGGCIPASMADTPIDFESLKGAGAMMGSGGLVVLDNADCMVDIARYFLTFTQGEACGKCSFGRIGTRRMLEILDRLCTGTAEKDDLEKLEELAKWTLKGSMCALCGTAPNPVLTTLKYFREEYEAHMRGECPAGKCKELVNYSITDDCIGCTLCAQECPVDAIAFKPHEKHEVDTELCIKCDACRQVCPEDCVIVK